MNWAMAAALVALFSALVAIAAIYFSQRATRFSIGVQTLLQLESRFDSSEMRRSRSALASYVLAQPPTGEIPEEAYCVISLFETLGFLLRRKAIDLEMAWNSFDPWVPIYWSAIETFATEHRKTVVDPTLWQDWEHAAHRITEMQAQRSKATVEHVQTRYVARRLQFLREEANWSAPACGQSSKQSSPRKFRDDREDRGILSRWLRSFWNKGSLMTEQIPNKELYEIAILQMRYEGQLLWQRFAAFLTPHTIFLAFLLHAASSQHLPLSSPGIFCAAIVGIALCVPWFAVYVRSSAYYIFRLAQAREAEPQGWELLAGNAEKFSAGKPVQVGDSHRKPYRMPWLARKLRTEYSGKVMIIMFFLVYLVLVAITGPWWGKNCA